MTYFHWIVEINGGMRIEINLAGFQVSSQVWIILFFRYGWLR